jgi:hypothetical protein
MLESLKHAPLEKLRPRSTLTKVLALSLSACVHLLSLAVFSTGVFLIATGYPEVLPILYGIAACAFAWFMRPKPGKVPLKDVVSRTDFPALYALINNVASELGGRPIETIVINENFNAAYGVMGWRRVPVLWIGLPLWLAMGPQERLAILAHEVAHGVNGDGTRSFVVSSALAALDQWIIYFRAPLAHAATLQAILAGYLMWILSIPFAAVQCGLAQLLGSTSSRRSILPTILALRLPERTRQSGRCNGSRARSISTTCCSAMHTARRNRELMCWGSFADGLKIFPIANGAGWRSLVSAKKPASMQVIRRLRIASNSWPRKGWQLRAWLQQRIRWSPSIRNSAA